MSFLNSKGLYKRTLRTVVDIMDCYYLETEELGCKKCKSEKFPVLGSTVSFLVTSVSDVLLVYDTDY